MAAITAEIRRYFECSKRNPRPKSNYLQRAFQLSEEYKWCTTYGCTTCGAMPFRKFVIGSAIEKIGFTIDRKYKDESKNRTPYRTTIVFGTYLYQNGSK